MSPPYFYLIGLLKSSKNYINISKYLFNYIFMSFLLEYEFKIS